MMIRFTILALPHRQSTAPDGPRRRSAPHFTYSVLCVDSAACRLFVEGARHGAAAATDRLTACSSRTHQRSYCYLINDRARSHRHVDEHHCAGGRCVPSAAPDRARPTDRLTRRCARGAARLLVQLLANARRNDAQLAHLHRRSARVSTRQANSPYFAGRSAAREPRTRDSAAHAAHVDCDAPQRPARSAWRPAPPPPYPKPSHQRPSRRLQSAKQHRHWLSRPRRRRRAARTPVARARPQIWRSQPCVGAAMRCLRRRLWTSPQRAPAPRDAPSQQRPRCSLRRRASRSVARRRLR